MRKIRVCQRLHFRVSQTRKSKIKGTLTFEVANLEIPKHTHQQTTSAKGHVAQSSNDKCQDDSTFQAHVSHESE
jgi:hypothetical protein